MRLLVVDDDAVFREELSDLLSGDGHEVESAPSVPVAIERLEAKDFDLVFTDLKMPRHSGLELLKEVRTRWPQTLIVMITGFATVETAVEAMKVGAFDYIRKPFQIAQVQQVLELARAQLDFRIPSTGRRSPADRWLRDWSGRPELSVLRVVPAKVPERERVTTLALDYEDPSLVREAIRQFAAAHARSAVVLEEADRLFAHHRRSDILAIVESIAHDLDGKGPFVVTYDPGRLSSADARGLTSAVVSAATRATLEALANPMRRAILQRAGHGPISFTEALKAAEIDDSPKLSFHLRRLVDEGLLLHVDEEYRITPRGAEAIRLLAEVDATLPTSRDDNVALPETRDH